MRKELEQFFQNAGEGITLQVNDKVLRAGDRKMPENSDGFVHESRCKHVAEVFDVENLKSPRTSEVSE